MAPLGMGLPQHMRPWHTHLHCVPAQVCPDVRHSAGALRHAEGVSGGVRNLHLANCHEMLMHFKNRVQVTPKA